MATRVGWMAGAALVLATGTALGQDPSPAAEDIWTRFVEICPTVVDAGDPVSFSTGVEGAFGSIGQSADGLIRHASLQLSEGSITDGPVILMTHVYEFDEGRSVQCMLQIVNPPEPVTGLADLAGEHASEVFGDGADLTQAGGPMIGVDTDGGIERGSGDQQMVRISTSGFPPERLLMVHTLEQIVILTLNVWQSSED